MYSFRKFSLCLPTNACKKHQITNNQNNILQIDCFYILTASCLLHEHAKHSEHCTREDYFFTLLKSFLKEFKSSFTLLKSFLKELKSSFTLLKSFVKELKSSFTLFKSFVKEFKSSFTLFTYFLKKLTNSVTLFSYHEWSMVNSHWSLGH